MAEDFKIKGIEDLQEAQSGAASQGTSVPNYNDWNNVLADFEEMGIESTGSYEGDLALRNSMLDTNGMLVNNQENREISEHEEVKNNDNRVKASENVTKLTDSDSDQQLKATFANATSSTIAADYMRYFHQL